MEKEFVFTLGHRNPTLTDSEAVAYRSARQVMADSMVGGAFTYLGGEPCGTITECWLNEENAFVMKITCDEAMYDAIMEQMNRKITFSIGGVSK